MIQFIKMHGLGNDFMVIDGVRQSITLTPDVIRQWSDRHTGVGFDQCLLVAPASQAGIDFDYRIFNADGDEVQQCGNGARCLARFIAHTGLSSKDSITVATKTTSMRMWLADDNQVTVELPPPQWQPDAIPCQAPRQQASYALMIDGEEVNVYAVCVGNPHAVLIVDDVQYAPVATLGQSICQHAFFPEQVNVGFLQIVRPGELKLRVYERGCGETNACGSGAVAAAIIARRYLDQPENMTVTLPGGSLHIQQKDIDSLIEMTGPAEFVYEGTLLL